MTVARKPTWPPPGSNGSGHVFFTAYFVPRDRPPGALQVGASSGSASFAQAKAAPELRQVKKEALRNNDEAQKKEPLVQWLFFVSLSHCSPVGGIKIVLFVR